MATNAGLLGLMDGSQRYDIVSESRMPTPHLRFIQRGEKRILQQEWCIETRAGSGTLSIMREWLDIPLVEGDDERS